MIATALAVGLAHGTLYSAIQSGQPVKLYDDGVMVRVPVSAFGRTLYFLLDTGFTLSAIDSKYQPYLGKTATPINAQTPLGTNVLQSYFHCPDISIAGKPLGLRNITSLDLKMARLISGQPCDGILGMDFLSKNIVQIDFDRQTVSLSSEVPAVVKNTYVAIPLKRFDHHYMVEASANHAGPIDLLVDTGDNSSVSLNPEEWQKVFAAAGANGFNATVAGMGNQTAQSKIEVLDKLAVEGLAYTNLHATYIRNPADPSHLGLGFFRRHAVVFDFPDQMLYLEPGQRFSTPDKEDMSGLHLLRQGDTTIVYSVDENSPAAAQGIKPGDVIEVVNGQSAADMTMRAIRRMLKSSDGDTVTLQLKRGEEALRIELTLKQAI
ncbi:MAG: aspartyl protease family protein [Verrucomicrobiae bacterium]|nr:aspartyl protease family protein [Verrucomicrobiae bacterium]